MKRMIDNKEFNTLKTEVGNIPIVEANPTLEGTEAELTGLQVDDTKYAIPKGASLYTSTTDATEDGDVYTLDISEITCIEVNDYIAYLNSGAIKTLYQVDSISSGTATLSKIGDFGGGSQLYQHNIKLEYMQSDQNKHYVATFTIISSSATQWTIDDIVSYIYAKTNHQLICVNGSVYSTSLYQLSYLTYNSSDSKVYFWYYTGATTTSTGITKTNSYLSVFDEVETIS